MTREDLERLVWRYTARPLRVERKDGTRLVVRRHPTTERPELATLTALSDRDLFDLLPAVVQGEIKGPFAEYYADRNLARKNAQRSA